jgi:hypothetical protein
MESFWGSPKTDLVHRERLATRQDARDAIIKYTTGSANRLVWATCPLSPSRSRSSKINPLLNRLASAIDDRPH